MDVEIWSDIVCPWCYIGKRRFEKALAAFPHRDAVTVRYRAFQLDPSAEREVRGSRTESLRRKYGMSEEQVATMDERMERLAAEEGLSWNLAATALGNTEDAHRLVHMAREHGKDGEMLDRLYAAYFSEGQSIFDEDALAALGADAGLDASAVRAMLRSGAFRDTVAAERRTAAELGASGVPFFVVAGRYGVSGAQPPEVFTDALEKGWEASR
ncbi:MAG: DsbA family oxidoreductase [Vicinamibacterales bacterium]